MTDISEFKAPTKQTHPKGWEPSIEWDGTSGHINTGPMDDSKGPNAGVWAELIKDWDLDPEAIHIIPGSVQVRGWDMNVGGGEVKRFRYYRARLEPTITPEDHADIDALTKLVRSRKAPKIQRTDLGDRALVVNLADWQIGKARELRGGTPETVANIRRSLDNLLAFLKSEKTISTVYVGGLGDIIEQCSGHYPGQAFRVDLTRREQLNLAADLLIEIVDRLVALGLRVVLFAVPGNHGENRNGSGHAYTTVTDSDDLLVFDIAARVFKSNPERYTNVSVPLGAIAEDLTITLDIAGVPVAFWHGHTKGPGNKDAEGWWRGQIMGSQPVAGAAILVTGHYHHLVVSEKTGRTWFQCPTQDPGSQWWSNLTGQDSHAGMLTFIAGTGCGSRGWSDMAVL